MSKVPLGGEGEVDSEDVEEEGMIEVDMIGENMGEMIGIEVEMIGIGIIDGIEIGTADVNEITTVRVGDGMKEIATKTMTGIEMEMENQTKKMMLKIVGTIESMARRGDV